MEKRIKKIYSELYHGVQSKNELALKLDVNTKTIENTINKFPEDIILDKNIGGYRFNTLLPSQIPSNIFFQIFQDSIDNQVIKNDFLALAKSILSQEDIDLPMMITKDLSILAKKIIMSNIAINNNCTLKIDYFGNNGSLETKYIKPHKVFVDVSKYYIYASYIEKNEKHIGEYRTFALNGISSIEAFEYIKNEIFYIDSKINSYGILNKDKYVHLRLKSIAANFFKKEGLFNKDNFDFIAEEADGSVDIKMYYNNIQEIVTLIQRWMPFISVQGDLSEVVYKTIQMNYEQLQ